MNVPSSPIRRCIRTFLAVGVAFDLAIDRGRFAGFGVSIVRSDRVHFHVRPLGFDKFLVNVAPTILADFVNVGIKHTAAIAHLAKELLAAAAGTSGVTVNIQR